MKYIVYCILAVVLCGIGLVVVCFSNRDIGDYVKYRVFYSDYLYWRDHGGPWSRDYYEPLILDRSRDRMVLGLPVGVILSRFPFLVDMNEFGPDTYKTEYLKYLPLSKGIHLYWFSHVDGSDWVVIVKDGIGHKLNLVKG